MTATMMMLMILRMMIIIMMIIIMMIIIMMMKTFMTCITNTRGVLSDHQKANIWLVFSIGTKFQNLP